MNNQTRFASIAFALFCLASPLLAAEPAAVDPAAAARKQELQGQVRRMARQLVAGVLDVQIQQLEENSLVKLELYRDIRGMREHLDELVDAEMAEVVAVLERMQEAPPQDREKLLVEARQKSRDVLVRLLVERQNLLRRLRVAEIAAQVRRLIEMQSKVLADTRTLPEQSAVRRETLVLKAVEDQRDIKTLYLGLKQMLADVGTWGGPVGAEALGGLQLLEVARVDAEIDNAAQNLEQVAFDASAQSQESVIRGLRRLLEIIRRAQGLVQGDPAAARNLLQEISQRQQEIRQATSQADPAQTDELVQQQTDVGRELAELREQFDPASAAQKALEEAAAAAQEASAQLFEEKHDEALAQQDRVLDRLAEAARQMDEPDSATAAALTPEQFQQLINDLAAARQDVERIRREQDAASQTAQVKPAEAAPQENRIADELAEVPKNRHLPTQVDARLAEAQEAARDAAGQMDQPPPERRAATQRAEQAIQQATAEIEAALADARRQQLGVEIAELAVAAETLDRAAAAERQIGREAKTAAAAETLDQHAAEDLAGRQAQVGEVASQTAEALSQRAPQATKTLQEAKPPIEAAAQQLAAARQQPNDASKEPAAAAAKNAEAAAEKLADAATDVRRRMQALAHDLAAVSGQQLEQARDVRQAVDEAVVRTPEPLGERLERLAQAQRKVAEAAAQQARAAGRPEAAQAMELATSIRDALAQQDAADRAASRQTEILEAIGRQQQVAKTAKELAARAAAEEASEPASAVPVAAALHKAAEAAEQAARETLDSHPAQARAARAEARQALNEALQAATAQAELPQSPPGQPNMEAQAKVAATAEEARHLAEPDALEASKTLGETREHSRTAETAAARGDEGQTRAAQAAAAGSLQEASRQLAEARDRLAREAAEQLSRQAAEAGQLADRSVPVDPGANAALQSAESGSGEVSRAVPETSSQAAPAEAAHREAMDAALTDLAAREEQLARDVSLAEQLAQLIEQMLSGADQLPQAEQAAAAGQADPQAAAPWLQFNRAQQAAAQAAQDVAGQPMPASPLQQAHELAMQLPTALPPGLLEQLAGMPMPPSQAQSPPLGGAVTPATQIPNVPPVPTPATESGPRATAAGAGQGDVTADGERPGEEPWLVKLPPEVQKAIRASSTERPPRGYEEKLERYYKALD